MIKYYVLIPAFYKLFSFTSVTRRLYRFMGNTLGDKRKKRLGLRQNYIDQGRNLLLLIDQHCWPNSNSVMLEIGTGWLHWYATFIRLFHNNKIHIYDIRDNRQFNSFVHFYSLLKERLTDAELDRNDARYLLENIPKIKTVQDFYELTGLEYTVDEQGELRVFADNKFDIIFSCAVFEHINKSQIEDFFKQMHKILKPGGFSVQIIDIGDHYHYLAHENTHIKQYLSFSNKTWKRYFDNQLFYINRLQASEWLDLFEKAGFELVHKKILTSELDNLKVHDDFKYYSIEDQKCHQLVVVHRKK